MLYPWLTSTSNSTIMKNDTDDDDDDGTDLGNNER